MAVFEQLSLTAVKAGSPVTVALVTGIGPGLGFVTVTDWVTGPCPRSTWPKSVDVTIGGLNTTAGGPVVTVVLGVATGVLGVATGVLGVVPGEGVTGGPIPVPVRVISCGCWLEAK